MNRRTFLGGSIFTGVAMAADHPVPVKVPRATSGDPVEPEWKEKLLFQKPVQQAICRGLIGLCVGRALGRVCGGWIAAQKALNQAADFIGRPVGGGAGGVGCSSGVSAREAQALEHAADLAGGAAFTLEDSASAGA